MDELLKALLAVFGAIFLIFLLASAVAGGGRQSTKDSILEAANETANSIPVVIVGLIIIAILLLSGAIAR